MDSRSWRGQIVTGDEMQWIFDRNAAKRENVWMNKPAPPPITLQVLAKKDTFTQKFMCLVGFRRDN